MTDASQLIVGLRQPTAYDHAVDSIELIETHISWVLLTGEFAYKIKKPVDLGFVDFSTLDKRLACCREELRLNGRLAPELYLDVVPVTGEVTSPRMGGDGAILEYAVKMRQFSQDRLLDRLLERGALLPEHIDALAVEVADFHAATSIASQESSFGDPDSVWQPVRENFRHLPDSSDHPTRKEQLKCLREWAEAEFQRCKTCFEQRKEKGKTRECHGDLHLGNMILNGDQVVLFDCIEFNERLRWIDVISEIAFTVMDLEDRGRKDLARRFLNAYLEQTGDYPGLQVLPYFLVYRATVRAKVAGIRLSQPGLDAKVAVETDRLLQSYLDLAESYTRPPQPQLLITHGPSGSGKSTVTQSLLEELPAVRIRSDVERKRLFQGAGERDGLYSSQATQQTYAKLAESVRAAIGAGFSAIADATFLRRSFREEFRQLADELGVRLTILDFTAPVQILRERVSRRASAGSDVSDADLHVLELQIQQRDPLEADELANVIPIDTERQVDAESVVRQLN